MLSKLSIRNVKRSFSDYSIYFLTLALGVCFFYSFNSIESQQFMLDLSKNQQDLMNHMIKGLEGVSIFVSFILAFLILYANQFLVKRRKKELGIYKTLGMSKWNVSKLFLMETLVVGIFALAGGLVLGTLMSQGFSMLASSVFDVDVINYEFVFSVDAMIKTIIFFSIVFIVVIIFNTVAISKFTLLELLYGSKKNENIKIKNPVIGFIIFIISILMIISSYAGFIYIGISGGLIGIAILMATTIIGTVLFFFSLSSFFLSLMQSNKRVYFKNLNMFLVRQVGSKINTNFLVMSLICLMLTSSITVLAGGFGYKRAMDEELKLVSPYDVTLFDYIWSENEPSKPYKFEQALKNKDISLDDFSDYTSIYYYDTGVVALDLISPYISSLKHAEYAMLDSGLTSYAISESDYRKLTKMQGIESFSMNNNEVIAFTNMIDTIEGVQSLVDNGNGVTINGREYTFANEEVQLLSIQNTEIPRDMVMLVLPDERAGELSKVAELFVADYKEDDGAMDARLTALLEEAIYDNQGESSSEVVDELESMRFLPYTKTYIYETSQGFSGALIFVGIYIGTIFLISSAAILTLQQLSEASDNLARYKTLKSIGVGKRSINRVIFNQIFIYFMVPLIVAISHSVVGIIVMNNAALSSSSGSIIIPALVGASVLIILYGIYFLLTYKTYKSIVK